LPHRRAFSSLAGARQPDASPAPGGLGGPSSLSVVRTGAVSVVRTGGPSRSCMSWRCA